MNRTDWSQLGKHGLTLADFAFMQNAYSEAFEGVSGFFGNCILSGVALTATPNGANYDVAITAGYMVLDGEIVKVEAHTIINLPLSDFKWKIEETVVSPSPVPYADATLKYVHYQRRATLDGSGSISVFAVALLKDVVTNHLYTDQNATPLSLNSEWQAGYNPVPNPGYVLRGKTCHLFGDIFYKLSSPPTPTQPVPTLLPGEARPLVNQLIPVMACDWDTLNLVPINIEMTWMRIDTSGNIYIPHDTGKSVLIFHTYPVA